MSKTMLYRIPVNLPIFVTDWKLYLFEADLYYTMYYNDDDYGFSFFICEKFNDRINTLATFDIILFIIFSLIAFDTKFHNDSDKTNF